MVFAYIAREDRSVLELIDSDYTFLNAKFAELYGIKDVSGTPDAQGHASQGQPAWRRADPCRRPARDLEPNPNLAGEAWPVHPRKPAGYAGAAATGRRPTA